MVQQKMDAEEIMSDIIDYGYYYDTEYNKYVGEDKLHLFIQPENNETREEVSRSKLTAAVLIVLVLIIFVQSLILLAM